MKFRKWAPWHIFFKVPFWWAYFWRGLYTEGKLSFKIGYAYTQREVCVSKSIGLAYSWKEIYVSNLQKDFTETLLEYVDLSKTRQCKYFLYMDRESPNQTEEGTMQTEINCDTLTAIIWQIQKLYVTVPLLLYFLCIWGQFPSTSPRGLIQLVRERLSEKMWTRQSRKVICDMINTLFLTL